MSTSTEPQYCEFLAIYADPNRCAVMVGMGPQENDSVEDVIAFTGMEPETARAVANKLLEQADKAEQLRASAVDDAMGPIAGSA